MGPERPTSLIVLVCVFLVTGLASLALSATAAYRGTPSGSFNYVDLIYVAIAVGLLRGYPYGPRWAVLAIWVRILLTCVPLAYLINPLWMDAFSLFGKPLRQIPRAYVLAYVLVSFTIAAWALRVLRDPNVRLLFTSSAANHSSSAREGL